MSRSMDKQSRALPIAVFDSGMGGVSVLRELLKRMPNEDYLYYGDSANAPYGTKTVDAVRALTLARIGALHARGIKAAVIACNTATSAAVKDLRDHSAVRSSLRRFAGSAPMRLMMAFRLFSCVSSRAFSM